MILVSHPTGNRNVRAVIEALEEADLLTAFHTTLAFSRSSRWVRITPARVRAELLRRSYDIAPRHVRTRPWRELSRHVSRRVRSALSRPPVGAGDVDEVYRDLDLHVAAELGRQKARTSIRGVYAYEDGAAQTFAAAREKRFSCFYDLPIAFWAAGQRLLKEEARRLPQWESTLGIGGDDAAKRQRKTRELELADVVICPSQFVVDSLPLWARHKKTIVVARFGSPEVETSAPVRRSSRFRVLFAGGMTQRKGLADVFAAMRRLGGRDIELVVMGSPLAPMDFYRGEYPLFTYEPTRPHDQVLALMRSCDALVLPSIVEGRALVIQEAMSQGLPVVITPNTGAEDLVESGRTGFVVPIRSPEEIADRLAWMGDHRSATRAMGERARTRAAACRWSDYGATIVSAIQRTLSR